ncbi:ABC1 family protein [Cardiosporidium cionae]|uniref:ABC1 family protein n=1 Tax=Cardiosporidium cionae TaxID=476202 RepID=A0ABQ7J9G6_9APIC|nr:ABC1 family protein [Cardiosporidium cionae]|eukprot:KAF8820656.1 ABC1 family protein [Cardiosporidium cionae]
MPSLLKSCAIQNRLSNDTVFTSSKENAALPKFTCILPLPFFQQISEDPTSSTKSNEESSVFALTKSTVGESMHCEAWNGHCKRENAPSRSGTALSNILYKPFSTLWRFAAALKPSTPSTECHSVLLGNIKKNRTDETPCTKLFRISDLISYNIDPILSTVNDWLKLIRRTLICIVKSTQIFASCIPLLAILPLTSIKANPFQAQLAEASWNYFFWIVELCGPTCIKFLQWAATRVDLFPEEFCVRCSRFHYHGTQHPYPFTVWQLEQSFGKGWQEFLSFDPRPIGSGCIAQVYRGHILSEDKQKEQVVAIKVRHPNVPEYVEIEFLFLKFVGKILSKLPCFQWVAVEDSVNEFCEVMKSQLDLRAEADKMIKFKRNFDSGTGLQRIIAQKGGIVAFPSPFLQFCTPEVMISTFEEGLHLGDWLRKASENFSDERIPSNVKCTKGSSYQREDTISPEDRTSFEKFRKNIGYAGMIAFLKMLFIDNFVHMDLHPGNILLRFPKDQKHDFELIFLDCGLTISLDKNEQKNFLNLFSAIFHGDGRVAGNLLVQHAKRQNCPDADAFCAEVADVISCYNQKKMRKQKFEKIFVVDILYRTLLLSRQYQVELDSKFVAVLSAILVLDGVGHQLDPHLDILLSAIPFRSLLFP